MNSKNEEQYRPNKIKDIMRNPDELKTATKSFLQIVDNDMMNPFGGGHTGF
jgi:hypothetical protein